MTIHKSAAAQSGLMPDFGVPAGITLSRSASFSPSGSTTVVSGDTIQMIPIPKNAKLLSLAINYPDIADSNNADVGDGGDPDRFMADVKMSGANTKMFPGSGFDNTAGFLKVYNTDDTIDIAIDKGTTAMNSSQTIEMFVSYMMVGTINDEG